MFVMSSQEDSLYLWSNKKRKQFDLLPLIKHLYRFDIDLGCVPEKPIKFFPQPPSVNPHHAR